MNSLYTGIWNKFSAATSDNLYTSISGRMYLKVAPQKTDYPYIVFFTVSQVHERNFDSTFEDLMIQFNVFSQSSTPTEAGNILSYLQTFFDDKAITVAGYEQLLFQRESVYENNDLDEDPPIFGYAVEYHVYLEST